MSTQVPEGQTRADPKPQSSDPEATTAGFRHYHHTWQSPDGWLSYQRAAKDQWYFGSRGHPDIHAHLVEDNLMEIAHPTIQSAYQTVVELCERHNLAVPRPGIIRRAKTYTYENHPYLIHYDDGQRTWVISPIWGITESAEKEQWDQMGNVSFATRNQAAQALVEWRMWYGYGEEETLWVK
jgi:hypothetical protein